MQNIEARLAALPLWAGPLRIEELRGGLTNRSLLITASEGRFVARLAGDERVHGIDRRAEQAATRAAAAAGLGPDLLWAEPDLMILRHIEGRTLEAVAFGGKRIRVQSIELLQDINRKLPLYYVGQQPDRSPLTILQHYRQAILQTDGRWRDAVRHHLPLLALLAPRLAAIPRGFAHNDVHGANLIDDGTRLWLIDWEYAGQGQPLADLASLANNALLQDDEAEAWLDLWLGGVATPADRADFTAMRLAAALRDLFWGYAQDETGQGAGLAGYIAINEARVRAAAARL